MGWGWQGKEETALPFEMKITHQRTGGDATSLGGVGGGFGRGKQ